MCKAELKEKTRLCDNFDADKSDFKTNIDNLQAQLSEEIQEKMEMTVKIEDLKT